MWVFAWTPPENALYSVTDKKAITVSLKTPNIYAITNTNIVLGISPN